MDWREEGNDDNDKKVNLYYINMAISVGNPLN